MILITVRDTPRPGGSKKGFYSKKTGKTWVVDANPHTKTWRDSVRAAAFAVYKDKPLTGPLKAEYIFRFSRPASHYGSGKNADKLKPNAPEYHTKKPDLTKLIRSTEDALTGIVWTDDSQCCERIDCKMYATEAAFEGVTIRIVPLS